MTRYNCNIGNWGFSILRNWRFVHLVRYSAEYPQKWELQVGPFVLERYRK